MTAEERAALEALRSELEALRGERDALRSRLESLERERASEIRRAAAAVAKAQARVYWLDRWHLHPDEPMAARAAAVSRRLLRAVRALAFERGRAR